MNNNALNIISNGDVITNFTAIILLLLSLITWSIFIYKYIYLRYSRYKIESNIKEFWLNENFSHKNIQPYCDSLIKALDLARNNVNGQQKNLSLSNRVIKNLRYSLSTIHKRINFGHSFIATVASTTPFLGLFGTVWGIYHALNNLGTSEQLSIEQIATPVAEALIMTALGLLVALPAVVAYNILSKKSRYIYHMLENFAKDLHNLIDSNEK